jgi:hypothetical protein
VNAGRTVRRVRDRTTELSPRGPEFARLVAALGLVGLVAGIQLLALLSAISIRPWTVPREMHEPWFAATALAAAGVVLASGGTLSLRRVLTLLRTRDGLTAVALAVGATTFWALAVWAVPPGGVGRSFAWLGVPVVQVALLGAWAAWADRQVDAPELSPRTWGNLLIVLFLALSAITVALRLPDVYPFSEYTMYSHARVDPYTLSWVVFETTDAAGVTRDVEPPATRHALLGLVRAGDDHTLGELAERVARRHGAERVTVYYEVIGVVEHPEPPGVEVVERREVVSVEP